MFFLKLASQSREANEEQELSEHNNTGIKVAYIHIFILNTTLTLPIQYKPCKVPALPS
jgi:hypothetical protein